MLYGTTSGVYPNTVTLGNVLTATVSTGLTAGTPYFFAVKARDANGTLSTLPSNEATVTPADTTATHASVSFAWDASVSGSTVGYTLLQGTSSGVYSTTFTLGNVLATTVSSGLIPNTPYFFAVKARDAGGNLSALTSNEVTLAPGNSSETAAAAALAPTGTAKVGKKAGLKASGATSFVFLVLLGSVRSIRPTPLSVTPTGTALLGRKVPLHAGGTVAATGTATFRGLRPLRANATLAPTAHANVVRIGALRASASLRPSGIAAFGGYQFLAASGALTPDGVATPLLLLRALKAFGTLAPDGEAVPETADLRATGAVAVTGSAALGNRAGLQAEADLRASGLARVDSPGLHAVGSLLPVGTARLGRRTVVRAAGALVPLGLARVDTVVPPVNPARTTLKVPWGNGCSVTGFLSVKGPLYAGFYPNGTINVQAFRGTALLWQKRSPHRDIVVPPNGSGMVTVSFGADDLPPSRGGSIAVTVTASNPTGILDWTVGTFTLTTA